jgi:hypothetical protein
MKVIVSRIRNEFVIQVTLLKSIKGMIDKNLDWNFFQLNHQIGGIAYP